ncbi:MAG: alpha/beta hydrolase [Lachnospiraceae bacterium]|nr:alpha/beta hydrolase [Lachnospiraceae bacterium]
MRKEEISFESRDGASSIYAVKWIPDETPKAILQITHGMAEHIGRYEDFATYMCEHGFMVIGDDHLGHGRTLHINEGKPGYICAKHGDTVMVRDEHRLKKIVQGENPGIPIFILGHSMGSFILRNYMYRYGTGINGAIVMGTGMQPRALLAVSRAIAAISGFVLGDDHIPTLLNSMAFGAYNKRIPDAKNDYEWLSKVDEVQQKYIADSDCGFTFTVNGFKVLFKLIWKLTDKANVEKMPRNLPVFMVSGEEDPVGNYGEAVKQVYESYKALGMEDVTLKLYKDDRHEILNETDHDQVYEDILNWIEAHISA